MGLLVTWACVGLALSLQSARADGNVGCLFSPSLCVPDVEWCYNDEAFGRCLQQNVDEEDLYRHELNPDELQELEREMERLLNLGYRWSHSYTQCLLQAMLYAYKIRTVYEPEVCSSLKDQDLSSALKAFESEEMVIDPQNVAYVKFTPSANNPHADFADEVYFPPLPLDTDFVPVPELLNLERDESGSEGEDVPVVVEDEPEYLNVGNKYTQRQFPFSLVRKKSFPQRRALHFSQNYNTPDDFRRGFETKDLISQNLQDDSLFSNIPQEFSSGDTSKDRIHRQLILPIQEEISEEESSNSLLMPMLRAIGDTYPSPREHEGEGRSRLLEELSHRMAEGEGEVARGYTEGGLVLIPDKQPDADQSLSEFLVGLNSDINWGFKRPERLDVKKPGPPFKTNNYAFKGQTEDQLISIKAEEDHNEGASPKHSNSLVEHQTLHLGSGTLPRSLNLKSIRRELIEAAPHSSQDSYQFAATDTNYVFIKFEDEVHTWRQGDHIIEAIARLLHVSKELLGDIQVVRNEVTFRVLPNNQDLSSLNVANKIGDIKDDLKRQLGVTVTSVGIVNKKHKEDHLLPISTDEDQKEKLAHKNSRNLVEDGIDHDVAQSLQQPSLLSINEELIDAAPQKKTYNPPKIDMAGSNQYDILNTNFAYIQFKEMIPTWEQGKRIIKNIEELLDVPNETFNETRVDRNEVTFRVQSNKQNLNASDVAKWIVDNKDVLKKQLGRTVTCAGIGDKTKFPTACSLEADAEFVFLVEVFSVFVVVLVTLVLSGTLFILIRRYSASRAKIRSLTTPDTEASKDYQELCRARMAAKPPQDATAPTATSHRIASLSRESDNSPSSRSSTSSWSEEPALSSMDISTGHMVLSYMEDHLRNKDRLETEWAALCAYEAEPCATIIAQRPENAKKNRYVNALPYDHARVVLNELSNISGSDYINASTITDHDPRNPAYIATQGPLPHTAPDLWQMVWEQGCVVMVMLTRLIENDVSMCHRYWPEEGSELYHIYEVHLVSEHFWCDDYLVRSFYLKNLKTTETRTVTQFHFMSWPEGGVPVSTKALLEFRRKVNKSFRGRSCPIVVHCSDGVGRTGTYCLLDMVLNRMAKGAKEIDIAATLEHIRDQRGGSVATKQQFQFVLAAVAEEVQAILRILPQQKPEQPPTTQPSAQ